LSPGERSLSRSSLAWDPGGKRLAAVGFWPTPTIWEAATGKELVRFSGDTKSGIAGYAVAWSPDGMSLVSSQFSGTITIWDAVKGAERLTLKVADRPGFVPVCWAPHDARVASGGGGTVKVWDSATGKELLALKDHSADVRVLAWSPDGGRL